jgi:hypothetical protein
MGTQTHKNWRFKKLSKRITELVGHGSFSLWSIDGDEGLDELREKMESVHKQRFNDKEFIALIRGKLQRLFGQPSESVQDGLSSFRYEIAAQAGKEKVLFQVCDRKAEEIAIYWEFSTSGQDVRNLVKKKLFELLQETVPADFSDAFSCEDDISVAYGCIRHKPWADIEISMNVQRRLFQNRMKSIQEKHYRIKHSMDRFTEESPDVHLPIFSIE